MERRFITLGMRRDVRSILRSLKAYGNSIFISVTRGRRKSLLLFNCHRRANNTLLSLASHANQKEGVRATRHLSEISSCGLQLFLFSRTTSLIRVILYDGVSILLQRFRPHDARFSLASEFLAHSVRGEVLIKSNATRLRGRHEFTGAQFSTRRGRTTRRGTTTRRPIGLQCTNRSTTFLFHDTSVNRPPNHRQNSALLPNEYYHFTIKGPHLKDFHGGVLVRNVPTSTTKTTTRPTQTNFTTIKTSMGDFRL